MATTEAPKTPTAEELAALHALPDDSLLTPDEAAAFLRLKCGTLAWYRCEGGGPKFTRVGPKLIRYRLGDLRAYTRERRPMADGVRRAANAAVAARAAKAEA